MWIRRFVLSAFVLCSLAARSGEETRAADGPNFDGPGRFGPLQDTVLLEDLEFLETRFQLGAWRAYTRAPSGRIYVVSAGSYMGENTGKVAEIRKDMIVIWQVVKDERGAWKEIQVDFRKP